MNAVSIRNPLAQWAQSMTIKTDFKYANRKFKSSQAQENSISIHIWDLGHSVVFDIAVAVIFDV